MLVAASKARAGNDLFRNLGDKGKFSKGTAMPYLLIVRWIICLNPPPNFSIHYNTRMITSSFYHFLKVLLSSSSPGFSEVFQKVFFGHWLLLSVIFSPGLVADNF